MRTCHPSHSNCKVTGGVGWEAARQNMASKMFTSVDGDDDGFLLVWYALCGTHWLDALQVPFYPLQSFCKVSRFDHSSFPNEEAEALRG